LHFDDRARLVKLALKLRATAFQFRNAPLLRAELGFPAAASSERSQRADLALAPPDRQMRAVQPFATQQRTDSAGTRAAIGLIEHRELIRRGEPSALRDRTHFRIRCRIRCDRRRRTRSRRRNHLQLLSLRHRLPTFRQ